MASRERRKDKTEQTLAGETIAGSDLAVAGGAAVESATFLKEHRASGAVDGTINYSEKERKREREREKEKSIRMRWVGEQSRNQQ